MADGQANPLMNVGQAEQEQQRKLLTRLMSRIAQPRSTVQPPVPPQEPSKMPLMGGIAHNRSEAQQMFVHNLFGTIFNAVQQQKQQELRHAVGVLSQLNNSWEKAQDLAQGDPAKAKQIFSQMPEVTHILDPNAPNGKKNLKQLGKLLQFDFMEPEKSQTVWHKALGQVVEAGKQLPLIKQISEAMAKHKQGQQQPADDKSYAQKETEASGMAEKFAGLAGRSPQQEAEIAKMVPSLVQSQGADLRQQERLFMQDYERQQKENFAKSIDSIKDPVAKTVAKGIQAQQDGDQESADKYFAQAHKAAEAKSSRSAQRTLPALIYDSINDPDPEKRAAAKKAVDATWAEQEKQLLMRGESFGMSRIAQYVNEETGEAQPLNGFQVQNRIKAGEHWMMVGNIPPDTVLAMQQVVRSYQPAIQNVSAHLKAFDNAKDRDIIARIKAANPNLRGMDESTLGTWVDQNLTGKLSPDGQALVQDIKVMAEVMGRLRRLTGQSSSEMNTSLLLGLLPDERTPNAKYGQQQLEKVKNYIDGMVQAPLLGGGRFSGAATPKKADTSKPDKPAAKSKVPRYDVNGERLPD